MNLLLTKLTRKHKLILFTCIVFMAMMFFWYEIYCPQQQQMAVLTLEVRSQSAILDRMQQFLNRHPDLAADERDLQVKQRFLAAKLPDSLELSLFMAQIEQAAAESRIHLMKVNPGECVLRKRYSEVPLAVAVRGDYAAVLDFLSRLERLNRFHTIAEMRLYSNHGALNGDFSMVIYSYNASVTRQQEESLVQDQ